MSEFSSNRNFQLWNYSVSHSRLLLRSPKGPETSNVDILFYGVDYLACGCSFTGLILRKTTKDDAVGGSGLLFAFSRSHNVYSLLSNGKQDVIIAIAAHVFENDLDYSEPVERYYGALAEPSPARGQLLARL